MGKKYPNQIIRPPKLLLVCGYSTVACIAASRWFPAFAQPLEGTAFVLMGITIAYAMKLLPDNWREKTNDGVDPFYRIPKGGKHIKGFVAVSVFVLVMMGAVMIASWLIKQLGVQWV
jgi:hypothetical protein